MARNIVSGFLSIFSSRIAVLLITFVSTPLITRTLGTSGYGDFQSVTAIFSLLMIFVSSGISEGVQKFTGQRSESDWRSNVIGFYLRAGVAVAVVVGLGLLAFTWLGLVDLVAGNGGFDIYFYLLVVLVLAAQLREYTRRTLMGLDLERYSEPLVVANTLIWVVIGLALATFWASNTTEQVMSLFFGQIIAGFAVAAIGFPPILRRIDTSRLLDRTPSNYPVREFVTFNGMTIALLFLVTSLYRVDIILIRSFVGASQAGIYSAALALAEYLWFVPTSLQILFIHSTSDLWERRRISIINDMASRATRYTALVVVLMALGIAALAPLFVPWYYSASYAEAVAPLYVLLPGAIAFAVARPMFSIGQGNGNLRPLIVATGVAALLNLVLNLLLIPRFGITGAAFATSLGYASMLVMHTWSARYLGFNPLGDLRAGRIVATAALSALPIFGLAGAIQNTLVALAVVPIVGAAVYTLIAIATGALDIDEILEILAAFPEPIGTRATALRHELSGQNLIRTNMMSKLLTGAGVLLLALGIVLSAGTLLTGPDGGPGAVTNGTPTDTQTPISNTPADGGGTTTSDGGGSGATETPGSSPDTTNPDTDTDAPPPTGPTQTQTPDTQTPGTQSPTPSGGDETTQSPGGTPNETTQSPSGTPNETTQSPGGTPNETTQSPSGTPNETTSNGTQAPGQQGPNTGTETQTGPGGSTDTDGSGGDSIIDLPGGGDDGDGDDTSTDGQGPNTGTETQIDSGGSTDTNDSGGDGDDDTSTNQSNGDGGGSPTDGSTDNASNGTSGNGGPNFGTPGTDANGSDGPTTGPQNDTETDITVPGAEPSATTAVESDAPTSTDTESAGSTTNAGSTTSAGSTTNAGPTENTSFSPVPATTSD